MITLNEVQILENQKTVLHIPKLEILKGNIVAFVGPADSGRDMLFELLIGFNAVDSGDIDIKVSSGKKDDRNIGVMFRENNLYSRMNVKRNLKFHSRMYRLPKERSMEILHLMGLQAYAKTRVSQLSSSLKRRVSFGRAIQHDPDILILSEPFSQCDEITISLISRILQDHAREGKTILLFCEDDANLGSLCDIIHTMQGGKIQDSLHPADQSENLPFMIPAKQQDRIILINPPEILFIYAQNDRTYLQTIEGSLQTQFTLSDLESKLTRSGFFRAHRSYLVNLQHVKEVIPYTRNSFSLRLRDDSGTILPLSKSAEKELRDLLGY